MGDRDTFERKGLKHLARIEKDLEEIKGNPRRTFLNGMLYGAGAFVGGILAILLLGWGLSVLGLIPGIGTMVEKVQSAVQTR